MLAALAATVHFPYLTAWPERAAAADREAALRGFARLGNAFREAGVDTLVVFTSEHIVNLQPRLAPPFTVAVGAVHPAFPEPHFNLPAEPLAGDPAFAHELVRALYEAGFDAAHSSELRLDHGTVLPLTLMELRHLPVVPIVINSIFPPLPTLERCRRVGEAVAASIGRSSSRRRIGMLATGGISHTVGAPGVERNDPAFDDEVLRAIRSGDLEAVCAISDERLDAAGNGTHEIRNWVALAAAAGARPVETVTAIPFAPGWDSGVHQLLWSAA